MLHRYRALILVACLAAFLPAATAATSIDTCRALTTSGTTYSLSQTIGSAPFTLTENVTAAPSYQHHRYQINVTAVNTSSQTVNATVTAEIQGRPTTQVSLGTAMTSVFSGNLSLNASFSGQQANLTTNISTIDKVPPQREATLSPGANLTHHRYTVAVDSIKTDSHVNLSVFKDGTALSYNNTPFNFLNKGDEVREPVYGELNVTVTSLTDTATLSTELIAVTHDACLEIRNDSITVDGNSFSIFHQQSFFSADTSSNNTSNPTDDRIGIRVTNATDTRIEDISVEGWVGGIYSNRSDSIDIVNTTVSNSFLGISSNSSTDLSVIESRINSTLVGLAVNESQDILIDSTAFSSFWLATSIGNSTGIVATNISLAAHGGSFSGFEGLGITNSSDIRINNVTANSVWQPINLNSTTNATIKHVTANQSSTAVVLDSTQDTSIRHISVTNGILSARALTLRNAAATVISDINATSIAQGLVLTNATDTRLTSFNVSTGSSATFTGPAVLIQGHQTDNTTIRDGTVTYRNLASAVSVRGKSVTVSDTTITDLDIRIPGDGRGISITNSSGTTITSTTIKNGSIGLLLQNNTDTVIEDLTATSAAYGGVVSASNNSKIRELDLQQIEQRGLNVSTVHDLLLTDSRIQASGTALHVEATANSSIYDNVFNGSTAVTLDSVTNTSWYRRSDDTNILGLPGTGGNAYINGKGGYSVTCTPDGVFCSEPYSIDTNNTDSYPLAISSTLNAVITPSDPSTLQLTPANGYTQHLKFSAGSSSGRIIEYDWELVGGGQQSDGKTANFSFTQTRPDPTVVRLTVGNGTHSQKISVQVPLEDRPQVSVNASPTVSAGSAFNLSASVTDSFDRPVSIRWLIDGSEQATGPWYSDTLQGTTTITVKAVDQAGLSSSTTTTVTVTENDTRSGNNTRQPAQCGNGSCEQGEDWQSCSTDCSPPDIVQQAQQQLTEANNSIEQGEAGYQKLLQAQEAFQNGDYAKARQLAREALKKAQQGDSGGLPLLPIIGGILVIMLLGGGGFLAYTFRDELTDVISTEDDNQEQDNDRRSPSPQQQSEKRSEDIMTGADFQQRDDDRR
ncbi:MAG: NosD domain-containing protein [Candidatus Nanohaloarchaea archaeon]|nr:NosD domain-containing protein [Candidatus Nanohaloarchaea archaeon]